MVRVSVGRAWFTCKEIGSDTGSGMSKIDWTLYSKAPSLGDKTCVRLEALGSFPFGHFPELGGGEGRNGGLHRAEVAGASAHRCGEGLTCTDLAKRTQCTCLIMTSRRPCEARTMPSFPNTHGLVIQSLVTI
jgi:hypothetical protein